MVQDNTGVQGGSILLSGLQGAPEGLPGWCRRVALLISRLCSVGVVAGNVPVVFWILSVTFVSFSR